MVFLVQFGINLHKWVFQKPETAWAASASAISAFWKTHKCKLIPNWMRKTDDYLLIYKHEKLHGGSVGRSLSHKSFVIILSDIIGLEKFVLSFSQS